MSRLVRKNHGRNHSYWLDGVKVDGVTTMLNAMPGPPPSWGAEMAASAAVDSWDELSHLKPSERLKRLKGAADFARDSAANRGTEIHTYGEQLVHGQSIEVPDALRGPVDAYARFLDRWKIEPIATETPLASTQHRYGGTADLWARIGVRDSASALLDLKSGKSVQAKTALQLACYRYADLWQPDGEESEQPMIEVDQVWVAHVLPDDVRMMPVVAGPEQLRSWLYVRETAHWMQRHDWWQRKRGEEPLIGEAESPEGVLV